MCDPARGGPLAGHAHVTGEAYAGSGKSRAIVDGTRRAAAAGARVAVAAGTNEQVRDLARRLGAAGVRCCHFAADGEVMASTTRVASTTDLATAAAADVVVATPHKLGTVERFHPGRLGRFDVGALDEAFQVRTDTVILWGLELSNRWAFVGDSGQIAVFTRLSESPYPGVGDPVTSVAASSVAQGADHGTIHFDWTWRLRPEAAVLLDAFYPTAAPAATVAGDREYSLRPPRPARGVDRAVDRVWDRAAKLGWGYLELAGDSLDPLDAQAAHAVAACAARLLARGADLYCERHGARPLRPSDVAIMVSTHDQEGVVHSALRSLGMTGVTVDTANALQGLEYAATVVWHPLSGVLDPLDAFRAARGRLCVMATRQRHATVIVGRAGIRHVLAEPPLSADAPPAGRPDPLLGGWLAHTRVLAHLDAIGAVVAA
jgi:hypothetical protein